MRRMIVLVTAALIAGSAACSGAPEAPQLTEHEKTAIKVCDGIVRLFEGSADRIWPGFDLARRPFLVYIPGRWALLVNPPEGAKEFGRLPAGWPPLGIKAGYLPGQFRDLVGQLAFDLEIGGAKVVGLGLLEGQFEAFGPKTASMFGFIVHEAFHQYQNEAFGEIAWEREERYPILDADNAGLAALEMRILADAVAAALQGRRQDAEGLVRMFAAVRTARWAGAPSFVERYEQGQEIREGTAAYVEKKSLELARGLDLKPVFGGKTASLARDLEAVPVAGLFRSDFAGRTTNGAVSPDDMIRNRIYPVGSALGFLADLWGPGWKQDAVREVGAFAFHRHLAGKLGLPAEDMPGLQEEAKARYGYAAIRTSAADLIAGYRTGFEKDLAVFEAQEGERVEIGIKYRSISRSRSSQGRSWVVDDGGKSLLTKVRVYALKMEGLALQVKETAILEENDWDAKDKRVAFFAPGPPEVVLDGARRALGPGPASLPFREIGLTASGVSLTAKLAGTLKFEKGRISLEFQAPAAAK